jgi:hypothetical protein
MRKKQKKLKPKFPLIPKHEDYVHHPHDAYLRFMLSHLPVALELLKYVLKPAMFDQIDWNTLVLDKDTFTDKRMRAVDADTVYRAKLLKTDREVMIRFVKEYKSKIEKPFTPQLLRYASASMDNDLRQNIKMALPISILIYHGESPWEKERLIDNFKDVPDVFQDCVPDFNYIYLNLQELPVEQIMQLTTMYLQNILLALKFGRNAEKTQQYFKEIVIFASGNTPKELAINFFQATLIYLNSINTINAENMNVLLETLPYSEQVIGKTTYQQFVEIGEARAKAEAEVKIEAIISAIILNQPNMTDEQIAKMYFIELDLVQRLRKKMTLSNN